MDGFRRAAGECEFVYFLQEYDNEMTDKIIFIQLWYVFESLV